MTKNNLSTYTKAVISQLLSANLVDSLVMPKNLKGIKGSHLWDKKKQYTPINQKSSIKFTFNDNIKMITYYDKNKMDSLYLYLEGDINTMKLLMSEMKLSNEVKKYIERYYKIVQMEKFSKIPEYLNKIICVHFKKVGNNIVMTTVKCTQTFKSQVKEMPLIVLFECNPKSLQLYCNGSKVDHEDVYFLDRNFGHEEDVNLNHLKNIDYFNYRYIFRKLHKYGLEIELKDNVIKNMYSNYLTNLTKKYSYLEDISETFKNEESEDWISNFEKLIELNTF